MLNVKFNYKGNNVMVQCNINDTLINICSKFASKINEPIESKIYVYQNQLLNLNKTLFEQINDFKDNNQEIEIVVNDIAKNDTVLIKYNFNGVDEEIKVKREDNFLEIIASLIKKPINILFGGKVASKQDFKKNFNELANNMQKEQKQLNLIIFEKSNSIQSKEDNKIEESPKNNEQQNNNEEIFKIKIKGQKSDENEENESSKVKIKKKIKRKIDKISKEQILK